MLTFGLDKNPPTAAEIEAEKNRLVAERKTLKVRRIGAFSLVAVVALALGFSVMATLGEIPGLRSVSALVCTALAISIVFVFSAIDVYFFEDKLLFCEKRLAGAQNLSDEQAPPVVEACQTDPLCDSYRVNHPTDKSGGLRTSSPD